MPVASIHPNSDIASTDRPSCDIFFRIPKTASYTLRNLVSREYAGKPLFDTNFPLLKVASWERVLEDVTQIQKTKPVHYRAIVGHMKFGLHEFVPGPSRYITFLRHPVKRFVSYYHMLKRNGLVPSEHQFDLSRPDWNIPKHESFPRELDNGQTRALANADWDLPFGQCTEEHLKAAKANMDKHFAFVGLTERFDLSLIVLGRICGWRWHFYVAKNVTPRSLVQDDLSPEILAAMTKLNRFDAELYAYAEERFEEMVHRYGLPLQLEHRAYLACNFIHKGFHFVYRPAKQLLRGGKNKGKKEFEVPVASLSERHRQSKSQPASLS